MIQIDMEIPKWCGECPCYNHNDDTCRLTKCSCRHLWELSDEELHTYQRSICPMIEVDS